MDRAFGKLRDGLGKSEASATIPILWYCSDNGGLTEGRIDRRPSQ